jgi:hypothetical protein
MRVAFKLKRGPPPTNTAMARQEALACLLGTSYQSALFGAPFPLGGEPPRLAGKFSARNFRMRLFLRHART